MGAGDLTEALGRQRRAEQIVDGLGGHLGAGFAGSDHLADGGEAGPLMTFSQPADVGRDRAGAGLDPAMIAIDRGVRIRRSGFGIVEEQRDIAMQGSLVSFEGQDIVAALIDDPPGDVAL
ncbi:MAG: hypothetical protein K0S21_3544, partial [Rhizobiaceae bacterium]|nr:hypothetical protein [Rhizobiaceae bacterium]